MPQPIINDILPLTQIVAGSSQTVFSTNWTANAASDVVVYDTPFGNAANDVLDLVSPSQYTVQFIGTFQTVQVTFLVAPPQNDRITITRMTPVVRQNLYTNTNFTPSMLNQDFEIVTLETQENELVNQQVAPRYNYSELLTIPTDTILPILGANQFWVKDAFNLSIIAVDISEIISGGTVTLVNTGTGLTGGPITISGTISLVVPVAISNGGTGVTSVTIAPTASAWSGWDANKNLSANNHLSGYATTPTAAATTTLTVGSAYQQYFTGSTTQTVQLPVTSTLVLGQSYYIVNNSTGNVTVQSSGSNTIQVMAPNSALLVTCILTSGTTAASWNSLYSLDADLSGAVLLSPSGDQTITAHSLILNSGFYVSGNSVGGTAGRFVGYSIGGLGLTQWQASNNANNSIQVTYTNASHAQNTIVTFPDPGQSTGNAVIAPNALVNGNLVQASGTLGLVTDSGVLTPTSGNPLPLSIGGTSASLTAANGAVPYSTASKLSLLAPGTSGQLFQSGGAGAPNWTTSTYPLTNAINTLLYASSANIMAALSTANNGVLITSSSGVPSISSTLPTAVQSNITTVGTIGSGNWQATPIALAYGGTNANLIASNGGIFYSTASAGAILSGTATANQVLLSGASTTPAWSTATYPPTTTINQLLYSSANNVISGLATSATAVLTTSSSVPTWAASLSLALGGLNNNNTASAGGIFWSDASKGNILAGTATAGLALLSGASATPAWSTKPPITRINVQTFSSTGTYTPTAGTQFALAEGVGGGGQGGGATGGAAQVSAGGGGGGGAYNKRILTIAQIGSSQTVTIGAGGSTGGTAANGQNGGSTSVGTLLVCGGGSGGFADTSHAAVSVGGAGGSGGVASTGDLSGATTGSEGQYGFSFSLLGAGVFAGSGGNSLWGSGQFLNAAGNPGGAGNSYGGGGSGAGATASSTAGGAGAPGFVTITEYISV